jgi:hypothetical protein
MAQDEGCFGRISRAKRCWAPPGMRPHAPVQVVREYMYAYAAVAPAQGQMISLVLPEASTAIANATRTDIHEHSQVDKLLQKSNRRDITHPLADLDGQSPDAPPNSDNEERDGNSPLS